MIRSRRSASGLTAIAAVLLVLAAAAVDCARLPEWAQAIADSAQAVEESDAEHSFRVLLSERLITVSWDGTMTIRDRIAKQALQAGSGSQVAAGSIFLGENRTIEHSRAWHLPPDSRAKKASKRDIVDLTDTSTFLSDNRTRTVLVPDVSRGSLVFFELEATWTPYALSFSHVFGESEPVSIARLVISTPPGWQLRHQWLRCDGVEPTRSAAGTTWQLEGLEIVEQEPLSEPAASRVPLLVVGLVPPGTGPGPTMPAFSDWGELSAWMAELHAGRSELPAGAAEQVLSQVAGAGSLAWTDQVIAISRQVRDSVRYVAKPIGIGGYQPRPAVETLDTLWGDCKDKSTLLQGVLAAQGISSYSTLVDSSSRHTVAEQVPTLDSFNHVILAVVIPPEVQIPEQLSAVLEDEQLGRLLIVDPTDEYTSPGAISDTIIGKRALLIDSTDGHLVTLPGVRPEDHRLERRLQITLAEGGPVEFTQTTRRHGEPAWGRRADLRESEKDHRDAVEEEIRRLWIDAIVGEQEIDPETADGAFEHRLSWTIPALPVSDTERSLRLFAGLTRLLPRTATRRRELPVVYRYPRLLHWTTEVQGVPEEVALPSSKQYQRDGWTLTTDYTRHETTVTATIEIRLEQTEYPPDQLKDLSKLYSALASAERVILVFP